MEIPSGWMKNVILNGVSVLMNVIPAYVVSSSDNSFLNPANFKFINVR
jgi:hypothetical protein